MEEVEECPNCTGPHISYGLIIVCEDCGCSWLECDD
jgi:hypothetical protein